MPDQLPQLNIVGVLNVVTPAGSLVIATGECDMSGANPSIDVDPTIQQIGMKIDTVRTLFFDNSNNSNSVSVRITGTEQRFDIPPLSNGYYPIACQANSHIHFNSVGGASDSHTRFQLYNYHIEPCVWYGFGQPVTVSGTVPVSVADGADVAEGAKGDAAVTDPTANASVIALLKGLETVLESPYAVVRTPVQATSGIVAAAVAAATLPAVAAKTNYLSGFVLSGGGATAGSTIDVTITGLLGGTRHYSYCVPTGAAVPAPILIGKFDPPLPASGANVAIVCSSPSFGAGNTGASMNAEGFYQ